MNMPMCSRCKKNIAVVFITKIEGPDKTTQEGLCLKCARELGVKPLMGAHLSAEDGKVKLNTI